MPKCKKSDCREPALPYGKRYCAAHKAEYERKQREYAEMQKTLRKCVVCGNHLSKTRHDNGETCCGKCAAYHEAFDAEFEKRRAFDRAETVEALKDWMRQYLDGVN